MPLKPEQLQQLAQQYTQKRKEQLNAAPPNFGVPKQKTRDQQINAMPNADKLTKFERGVYGALPGITTWMENNRLMGGTISEQLDKFNSSWAGKALNFMDVLAEGLERTAGLAIQMGTDPDFDPSDLKAAWYAGSNTYDTMNLPTFKRGPNGKITGMQIPTDLPGSGGLNAQRAKLQRLMQSGVDPKQALAQVRDEYYEGLGALALRAQLNDTYGHVLGDPLNFLTAYLKPIQALKARRFTALTSKLTGGIEDVLTKADDIAKLARSADNIEDALKYTDEAYQLAQMAGDTKLAAKYGAEAADLAKQAGKAEDITRYGNEAGRLAGMSADEAAEYSDAALKALGKKQITKLDQLAIMMTGGDPFRPSKLGKAFEKVPILGKVAKQFQLTPASKAQELLTMLGDNIGSNVISRMINNPNAEADFVGFIRRASKGATGIEYGHGMMTLEGRTVQGFISGVDTDLSRMLKVYDEITPQRNMLGLVSQNIGVSPEKVLSLIDENPKALLQMLAKNGDPNIALLMQSGELTDDSLLAMKKVLENAPYNKEMFFAQALDAIETAAMRQAVIQFGVKSKGVLTRWAEAIKAAESLAFLKVNPGYPIRNMINNEVTMIARGVFGTMGSNEIDNFWKGFGTVPKRLGEAITPAQESAKRGEKLSEAQNILNDALRGGEWGAPDKVKDFFQKINLGKLDATKAGFKGRTFEEMAGRRAFTTGTMQFLRRYFKPKAAREYVNPKVMDAIAELSPDLERHLNNAIRASGAMEGKFDELLGSNLTVNVDSILDDVTAKLGTDVRQVLGDEVLETLHQKLPAAIAGGKLDAFNLEMRASINKHIDDLFNKQLENVVEHTKAQAMLGGPNTWNKKLGEAQDLFWGAHIEHAQRMPEATRLAREASVAGDFNAARALWAKEAEDSRQFFDRAFRRVDAYIEGLEGGAAELAKRGAKMPFGQTKTTFRQWQANWKDFFTQKDKLLKEFFDDTKGKNFQDVQKQLDELMTKATQREDELAMKLDESIANMIDDEGIRTSYLHARDALGEMRKADKLAVINIRNELAELPVEQRQSRWNIFWQERAQRMQEMRQMDAAARAVQQGDPQALAMFEQAAPGAPAKEGEFDIFSLANEYGVASASPSGSRTNKRILNTVNKYAPEEMLQNKGAGATIDETARLSDVAAESADEMNLFRRASGTEVPSAYEPNTYELSEGITRAERMKEIASYAEKYEGEYDNISIRVQDKVYKAKIGKPLKHKSNNWEDGEKLRTKVDGVSSIDINRAKRLSGIGYDGNVILVLGSNSAEHGEDVAELIMREPVVLDIIDDSHFFDKAAKSSAVSGGKTKPKKFTKVEDIPEGVARAAFDARAQAKGTAIAQRQTGVSPNFIADVSKILPEQPPIDLSMDMLAYGRTYSMLDEITAGAKVAAKSSPTLLKDLPAELQGEVQKAVRQIKNDMASTRYQAMKFGEWRRDSALLNYNRRTNFDNNLAHVAPFAFWSTSSMFQWAVESIDRPAMLTNYLRAKKLMATAGLERDGQASRTKGKFRIEIPFAPEWMGEQFVDPIRLMLPFDNWMAPFEQFQKDQQGEEGRTQRLLEQMLQEGKITQDEFDQAVENKAGAVWDFANAEMSQNDESERYDAWDFATSMASPHAPIMWAYNAAFGDKEDIGPFSPVSRMTRNVATMMGVEDWNNSKWNLEAKIRKQMGLPAYDKWDDYRIDRSLSNLAGDGSYTSDEVKEALAISALVAQGKMTPEQAKEQSEAYREGVKRSNQEYAGGGPGAFALGLLGISVTSLPKGEANLRALQDDFGMAYQKYKVANDALEAFLDDHPDMDQQEASELWAKKNPKLDKDADALGDFFDKYPEYETRLGLFDPPEVRMHKFMIDEVWKNYNDLPKLNQDEAREHLGQEFQEAFLDKATRSYDDIPPETMAVWLKMMRVDPLGGLTADQRLLVNLYGKVKFTDPETSNRVQTFYDWRKQNFTEYYDQQSAYYKIENKAKRKQYLKQNPELKQYWDWRSSFMRDNPDLVPYLTDDEKAIAKAKNQSRTKKAVPTAQELQINIDPDLNELVADYFQNGNDLPPVVMNELGMLAGQYGMTDTQLLGILGGSYGVR